MRVGGGGSPQHCGDNPEKTGEVKHCAGHRGNNGEKWGGNNKARMWGKRDDEEDEKRAWGEKSSRLWGKRVDVDELARLLRENGIIATSDRAAAELQDKRKWAKNKARMWGK